MLLGHQVVLQSHDPDEFGVIEPKPCGVVFSGMPRDQRTRVCKGLGGEFSGPQPLQASHKKGPQPEADKSCALLLLYLSAPRSQERPQELICALYDMSGGSGTPRRCDSSTELSKLPGQLLAGGQLVLGGTGPSLSLSPATRRVKAKSFPCSGPQCRLLMDEEEA